MKTSDVIKKPRLTEKAYRGIASNTYVFNVNVHAGKDDIKLAIEDLFNVDVIAVRTLRLRSKKKWRGSMRRTLVKTAQIKKAIVEIKDGQTIKIFDEIYNSDEK